MKQIKIRLNKILWTLPVIILNLIVMILVFSTIFIFQKFDHSSASDISESCDTFYKDPSLLPNQILIKAAKLGKLCADNNPRPWLTVSGTKIDTSISTYPSGYLDILDQNNKKVTPFLFSFEIRGTFKNWRK
jgi:hypothetical protein